MDLEKEICQRLAALLQHDHQATAGTATQLDQQAIAHALAPLIAEHDEAIRRGCQASLDHLAHETARAFLHLQALQSILKTLQDRYSDSLPPAALALVESGLARDIGSSRHLQDLESIAHIARKMQRKAGFSCQLAGHQDGHPVFRTTAAIEDIAGLSGLLVELHQALAEMAQASEPAEIKTA